jgi:hypothetical protein
MGSNRKETIKLEELLVKDDANRLILIQTNHDSSLVLKNYLVNGNKNDKDKIKTQAEYNLYCAFTDCEKFVDKWFKTSDLLELLVLIKYKLCFVFHELQDESTVYTVFEVLNSRGLEVDWIDKCKSMLMGMAYEKFNKQTDTFNTTLADLHTCWGCIYRTIGNKEIPGHEILKFTGTLYCPDTQSRVLKEEDAIEYFRNIATQVPKKVVEISEWLLDVATELNEIYSDSSLTAVTEISHARLVAVAIKLTKLLDESDKRILMEQWEKVTFRIFGLYKKDSRTKTGEYTRLAQKIMGINDNKRYIEQKGRLKELYSDLIKIGNEFPASGIKKHLSDENCYNGWEKEARYFFFKYELYLSKDKGYQFSDIIWENIWNRPISESVEHIYPQTESLEWKGKIVKKEYQLNRIGNLLIMPIRVNIRLQNCSFDIKKQEYADSPMQSVKEIALFTKWDDSTIEERTIKLLEWAEKEWDDIKL